MLISTVCRYEHFASPWFSRWRDAMAISAAYRPENRKHWEWCAIAQALDERGMLRPGRTGLGFAVGEEPLPALFAKMGSNVVGSDRPGDGEAWGQSGQHAKGLANLFKPEIVDRDTFDQLVSFQPVDMLQLGALPDAQVDYLWSSCAFEHLGTLERGLSFVKNAMRLLKPGGVAVHTTEFNCSSNRETVAEGANVIYRRQDLEELAAELRFLRCRTEPFDFDAGSHPNDIDYDEPPYGHKPYHVKLLIDGFVSTSVLIIVERL